MSIEFITKKEFQLYRQAQEKERVIDNIRLSLRSKYWDSLLSVGATVIFGLDAARSINDGNLTKTCFYTVLTIVGVGISQYNLRGILGKYRKIIRTEKELKQIKEKPEYETLDLIQ